MTKTLVSLHPQPNEATRADTDQVICFWQLQYLSHLLRVLIRMRAHRHALRLPTACIFSDKCNVSEAITGRDQRSTQLGLHDNVECSDGAGHLLVLRVTHVHLALKYHSKAGGFKHFNSAVRVARYQILLV